MTAKDTFMVAGSGIGIVENISASTITINNLTHKKTCVIPVNTSNTLVTGESNFIRIPSEMDNWFLIDAQASCSGSSTSGSPTFRVHRTSASTLQYINMLSTDLSIDEGKYDSLTAKVKGVISASSVYSGDKIKVSASYTGTNVTYAQVSLTFRG